MHVFSKTIMQYCVIEVREHPDFFLILIESTCVAIKKRNKFMTSNGKMWYHSDTMSEKMQKQSQQGRKKCWNNARIDHKKSGISDTPYTPYYYGTEKATFEQDFLIQKETAIIPIEVKAETNIRSQSLKAHCDKFHPEKAVRFSTLKYMDQEWMVNIPLYAVCNL